MAYVANITLAALEKAANGQRWYGETKECVEAVKYFCNAPQTTRWKKGLPVREHATIRPGTAIATFTAPNEGYRGHAAIYIKQDSRALYVLDQWKAQPFHPRPIAFGGRGVSNDGDKFYVVE